jgi:hypothetical protein
MLRLLSVLALGLLGCEASSPLTALQSTVFDVVQKPTSLALAASPSFADERGGGIFVDLAGRVVRLNADASRGTLEPHPSSSHFPGAASAVFALGPANALVVTERGLFVAEQGWLVAPAWQDSLRPDGVVGTAVAVDGTAWLAHGDGLFRLSRGALGEFKLVEAHLDGITALAVGPGVDTAPAVWFAREGKLFAASQTSPTDFVVHDAALDSVRGVVGLGPASQGVAGEVWAITQQHLLRRAWDGWFAYSLPQAPTRLLGGGRFAWLQAGDTLYRYDADAKTWGQAQGFESAPTLLAVDATGTAWVRVGEVTAAVAPDITPRLVGLYEGAQVFDGQLVLHVAVPSSFAAQRGTWALDDFSHELPVDSATPGTGTLVGQTVFSLAGLEANLEPKPVSLAALSDGWHRLQVSLVQGEHTVTRTVHFEFRGSASAALSWEKDIKELSHQRCDKCHAAGTQPELVTYAQWKSNASAIASAVRAARMPADGPLDAAGVATIVRWVNAGALP